MIRHPDDWRDRCLAVITDAQTGSRFRVSEEESAIMDLAGEATAETTLSQVFASHHQAKLALELMSEELLLAMYERRHGNEVAWSRFASMSHDDWRVWWAGKEAQARVEERRKAGKY